LQASAEHRKDTAAPLPAAETESGLSLDQVTAAAEGAGIDAEYVRLALAERSLPESSVAHQNRVQVLRALTGAESDALEQSAAIRAAPERVLEVVRSMLTRSPYELKLENTLGDDPTKSVLVYRIVQGMHKKFGIGGFNSPFQTDANLADGRALLITVRPDPAGARLSVRMPLFRPAQNLLFFTLSGIAGVSLGSVLPPDTVPLLLQGLLGAAGLIAGVASYRAVYRWALGKGERAMVRLLRDVKGEAERS
jgi:hypothetical protein